MGKRETPSGTTGSARVPADFPPGTRAMPSRGWVARLSARVEAVLREVLAGHQAVGLAIYPHHANPGDSAIWWGTVSALRRIGVRIAYACDFRTFDPHALRRALPEGPLLMSGGGNFGDVYPDESGLRERLLREVRDRPLLQLPQSLWFREERSAERLGELCRGHPSFQLLVRDVASRDQAARLLGLRARLCPDMAFALGDLSRWRGSPRVDVQALVRTDGESAAPGMRWNAPPPISLSVSDWPARLAGTLRGWPVRLRAAWLWNLAWRRMPGPGPEFLRRITGGSWDALAEARTRAGCRFLSSGRVLVTDRLHGHILALLAGQPHVAFDTSNGKLRAFHETWTRRGGAGWADTAEEALQKAIDFPRAAR